VKIRLAYKCHDLGRMDFYSRFTPLGLGTINALLRSRGHASLVVNASAWSWEKTARFLREDRPDILGLSVFTFNRHEAMRLAALARAASPGCLIVAGGPHASHLPHHLLERYPAIDLVVRGEGEETMRQIVEARAAGRLASSLPKIAGGLPCEGAASMAAGGVIDTPDRPVIRDLDRLPHPAADPGTIGVDPASQFEFIITSRGCPAACTFCSSPEFWGRGIRFRSAEHMIDEVRLLRERHGVVYVSVRDDGQQGARHRLLPRSHRGAPRSPLGLPVARQRGRRGAPGLDAAGRLHPHSVRRRVGIAAHAAEAEQGDHRRPGARRGPRHAPGRARAVDLPDHRDRR
jgi:radical SAM superfamily enzyme YgiQ (UPF0313 family)